MRNNSFTAEELSIAKSVDLTAVAANLGYTVQKCGRYHTLKEMDSIRIYDKRSWYRWSMQGSSRDNSGSQIDFLRVFADMEVKDAVFWLLDFAGYRRMEDNIRPVLKHQVKEPVQEKPKEFILPEASQSNFHLYSYLLNERALSKSVVDYFVSLGLIYESSRYHNIVFKGNDKDGVTRFASQRGVFDREGKSFKCDVAGNDKHYGFNVVTDSLEIDVFEAAIDLMSYMDIYNDYETNKLALGMVSDAPLETFLKEHPYIKIINFHLDNDKAGREATEKLMQKYGERGYEVRDNTAPEEYKDFNEWLVTAKNAGMFMGFPRHQRQKNR